MKTYKDEERAEDERCAFCNKTGAEYYKKFDMFICTDCYINRRLYYGNPDMQDWSPQNDMVGVPPEDSKGW